jgi:hypothetical protein
LQAAEVARRAASGRELFHFLAVGLELHGIPRDSREHGFGLAGGIERDFRETPLGFATVERADLAAECRGDHLVAEAHADEGELACVGFLEEGEFGLHPRLGIADVLLAAEADDAVHIVKVLRDAGSAEDVEAADVELEAVVAEGGAETTRADAGAVLEDDD